jgi:hypothetical protein
MARVNIYVTKDLKAAMDTMPLNWSFFASIAFRQAIKEFDACRESPARIVELINNRAHWNNHDNQGKREEV